MESKPTSDVSTASHSGAPSTYRLVIRVKLTPEEQRPVPVRRRWRSGALLLVAGGAAALLIWAGISMVGTDPISSAPVSAPSKAAPAVSNQPPPKPPTQPAETTSIEVKARSTGFVIKEVIPRVPRSARETVRGTIRVVVRVTVDKDGTVLAASADDPGPSPYFERLAVEASKQWTFAPVESDAQRNVLVRFKFTRAGTTARASLAY